MESPKKYAPTVTAGAYAANDVVGAAFEIDLGQNPRLYLDQVILKDADQNAKLFDIAFFSEAVTAIADNGAVNYLKAEMDHLLAVVSLDDGWKDMGNYSVTQRNDISIILGGVTSGALNTVYAQLITREIVTFSATDSIEIQLGFSEPGGY